MKRSRRCPGTGLAAGELVRGRGSILAECPECRKMVRTNPGAFDGEGNVVRILAAHNSIQEIKGPPLKTEQADDALVTVIRRTNDYYTRASAALPYSPDLEGALPMRFWNEKSEAFLRYMRAVFLDFAAHAVSYPDMDLVQLMARGQIGVGSNVHDAWDRLMDNSLTAAVGPGSTQADAWWLALLPLSQGIRGKVDINERKS